MELASIINQYYDAFMEKYSHTALPGHVKAINTIRRCRTPDSGELYVQCPKCVHSEWRPLSCGHRSCPKCQNHAGSEWIDRQQAKLLPVAYFMTTFTLPSELRALTWHHQRKVFSILFPCIAAILRDFGLNPKHLGAEIGMTMVLHTHNRRLDFHPHVHVVVPGGGVDESRRQWKKKKGKFLFNESALAKVFRARFLKALKDDGLPFPKTCLPNGWLIAGMSATE
jgi:hypothetical protein